MNTRCWPGVMSSFGHAASGHVVWMLLRVGTLTHYARENENGRPLRSPFDVRDFVELSTDDAWETSERRYS